MLLGEGKFSGMLLVLLILFTGSLKGSADVTARASLGESERSGSDHVTDVKGKEQNLNDSTVPKAVRQSSKVDVPVKEKALSVVEEVESSPMRKSSIQKEAATSAEVVSSEPEKDSQDLKIVEDKERTKLEQSGARKEMSVKKRDALSGQSSVLSRPQNPEEEASNSSSSRPLGRPISVKPKNPKKVHDLNGQSCSGRRVNFELKGSGKTAEGVSGEPKNSNDACENNSDTKMKSNSENLNSKSDEDTLGDKNFTRPEFEGLLGTSTSDAGSRLSAAIKSGYATGSPVSLSGYIQPSDSAVINNSKSLLKEGEGDAVPKVSDKANCPKPEVCVNESRNNSANDSRSLPNSPSESLQFSVNATKNPNCEATKCSDAGIVSKQKIPAPSDKIDCNPNVEQAENNEKRKVKKPKNLFSSSSFDLDLYLSSYFDVEGIIKRYKSRRRKVGKSFGPEIDRSVEKRTPEVEAAENEDDKSKPSSCNQTLPRPIDDRVKVLIGVFLVFSILSAIFKIREDYLNKRAERSRRFY